MSICVSGPALPHALLYTVISGLDSSRSCLSHRLLSGSPPSLCSTVLLHGVDHSFLASGPSEVPCSPKRSPMSWASPPHAPASRAVPVLHPPSTESVTTFQPLDVTRWLQFLCPLQHYLLPFPLYLSSSVRPFSDRASSGSLVHPTLD